MKTNASQKIITGYCVRQKLALPATISLMVLFPLVYAGYAWATQGVLFAVQTTNDPGITAGIVAIGGMAVGVIAIGGGAVGLFAVGGGALGLIAVGGMACGVFAAGGGAVGLITLGAGGIGRYVLAVGGLGRYLFTQHRRDPEAVELFCRYIPKLKKYVDNLPD